jgi:hypothetical protein
MLCHRAIPDSLLLVSITQSKRAKPASHRKVALYLSYILSVGAVTAQGLQVVDWVKEWHMRQAYFIKRAYLAKASSPLTGRDQGLGLNVNLIIFMGCLVSGANCRRHGNARHQQEPRAVT